MSDPQTTILPPEAGGAAPPPRDTDRGRMSIIIMYGLFFAGFVTGGLTYFAAIVLAYVQRDDLKGTIYESHIRNGMEVFWVTLLGGIVGGLLIFLGVGILILFFLMLWYLYRTIKGFLRALDARAYS